MEQASVSGSFGWQPSPRWGLLFTTGAILGGRVEVGGQRPVGPGILASATATYLPLYESGWRPFVLTSLSFGAARTSAESDDGSDHPWSAVDLRLGVMVGKTFWDRLAPFVAARVFGGPVFWQLGGEAVIGSDVHHYAVGAGLSLTIPGQVSIFVEAMPLGEQSATLGAQLFF